MPAPDWMLKVSTEDQSQTQAKLAKSADGNKEKKQKSHRHVRARAKLPSGPDRDKYELPDWVTDDHFKDMILQMLKTLANTQQRLRVLESVCADNFVVPSSLAPVAIGVTQAEAYHKEAITNSSEKDRGAPGPQVLYAFCVALLKCDCGQAPKQNLQEHIIDKIESLPKHRSSEVVSVFSLRPCYDTSLYKIVLVSQDAQVRSAFTTAMKALSDVKHFTAPAPASGQEDEVQKWIEKLESLTS